MAFIDGVLMLAVLFGGVISFFAGGVSPGTSGAVITRWFQRKRGVAMSVVAAGGSLGRARDGAVSCSTYVGDLVADDIHRVRDYRSCFGRAGIRADTAQQSRRDGPVARWRGQIDRQTRLGRTAVASSGFDAGWAARRRTLDRIFQILANVAALDRLLRVRHHHGQYLHPLRALGYQRGHIASRRGVGVSES